MTVASQQAAVRCVIMLGGTSRGLYVEIETGCGAARFAKLSFARTTRPLIDGLAGVPREPE